MSKVKCRMNDEGRNSNLLFGHLGFIRHLKFVIRHSYESPNFRVVDDLPIFQLSDGTSTERFFA